MNHDIKCGKLFTTLGRHQLHGVAVEGQASEWGMLWGPALWPRDGLESLTAASEQMLLVTVHPVLLAGLQDKAQIPCPCSRGSTYTLSGRSHVSFPCLGSPCLSDCIRHFFCPVPSSTELL